MPSLLDQFVVEVGLDPSDYDKGSREIGQTNGKLTEVLRKNGKAVEDDAKKSAAALGKIKTEVLGIFLAFAGASSVKSFLGNLLDGDASAGRLAKNLNVATQSVSAYRMVVRSLGGEAGDADATLQLLANSRESLRLTGTTGHDAELMRLGVTKEDLEDPLKALDAIAKTGETMKREDYFALLNRLGIPPGAIESLNHGKKGLDDLITAQKANGAASDEDARKAQEFQKQLVDLESKIMGAARPAIYSLVDGLNSFNTSTDAANRMAPIFIGILGAAATAGVLAAAPYIALAAAITAVVVAMEDLERLQNMTAAQRRGFEERGAQIRGDVVKALGEGRVGDAVGILGSAFAERASGSPTMYGGQGPAVGAPAVGGGGAGGSQGLAGRRAFIADFWRKRGYTDEQAQGLVAAMQAENGSLMYNNRNPTSAGRHHAYGLSQLVSADRRAAFRKRYGHEYEQSNYKEQLDFMDYELKHGQGGDRVRNARTAHEAMEATVRGYYRPGAGTAGDLQRGSRALGERAVSIGTININAPNANPQAVADKIPTAINARLSLSQGNQALLG